MKKSLFLLLFLSCHVAIAKHTMQPAIRMVVDGEKAIFLAKLIEKALSRVNKKSAQEVKQLDDDAQVSARGSLHSLRFIKTEGCACQFSLEPDGLSSTWEWGEEAEALRLATLGYVGRIGSFECLRSAKGTRCIINLDAVFSPAPGDDELFHRGYQGASDR